MLQIINSLLGIADSIVMILHTCFKKIEHPIIFYFCLFTDKKGKFIKQKK